MRIDENTYIRIVRATDWLEEIGDESIRFVRATNETLFKYNYEVFNSFANGQRDLLIEAFNKIRSKMVSAGILTEIAEIPKQMAVEDPRLFKQVDYIEELLTTLYVKAQALECNDKKNFRFNFVVPDIDYDRIYGDFRRKIYHKAAEGKSDFQNEINNAHIDGDLIGFNVVKFITVITDTMADLSEGMDNNFKELAEKIGAVQEGIKSRSERNNGNSTGIPSIVGVNIDSQNNEKLRTNQSDPNVLARQELNINRKAQAEPIDIESCPDPQEYILEVAERCNNDIYKIFSSLVEFYPVSSTTDEDTGIINSIGGKETIEHISGGDMTRGSCSSLALAYIGNKAGYKVQDFRGGNSRVLFASRPIIMHLAKQSDVKSIIKEADGTGDEFDDAMYLFKNVEKGKEYYFATGAHAAIIRRNDAGDIEYLELQNGQNDNGWKAIGINPYRKLIERFGISLSKHRSSVLIDSDSLCKNHLFISLLGYINTPDEMQKKGVKGSVK